MASSRRQQAQTDAGLDFAKEDFQRGQTLEAEYERQAEKQAKREMLMQHTSYRMMEATAKYMDQYYLDPIIGFLIPGAGDVLNSLLGIPFIYFSLVYVHSIPLTLAVTVNVLVDALLGAIPFYVGDVIDIFNKAYKKNLRLIVGYINDDKDIIDEVNGKAIWFCVLIVILCLLIYWLVGLVMDMANWVTSLF